MQSPAALTDTRALESEGARFWHYYHNEKNAPWHAVAEHELHALLRDAPPRYATVLPVDFCAPTGKEPSREEVEAARYKGPFYIDTDADDLATAIAKLNQLLGRLDKIGVDLGAIRIYCSGGRGFHLEIDASMFMTAVPRDGIAELPLIYKAMAIQLYVDTMDLRVYTAKRGRMWRTPNVRRENGNYKVRVTLEEARSMTPESYAKLVSAPRREPQWNAPTFNSALAAIYEQAAATVAAEENKRGRRRSARPAGEAAGNERLTPIERLIRSIADAALDHFDGLMGCWFPKGRHEGSNYVAYNPWRNDRNLGSFKIHRDGFFKDYASEAHKGGDLVALKRFLVGGDCTMLQAARLLAEEIGFTFPDTDNDTSSSSSSTDDGISTSCDQSQAGTSCSSAPQSLSGSTSRPTTREPVVISAMDLLAQDFPPVRWIVKGILPEGLSLLAGSPKTGKSWLLMEVALAIASGSTCLGGRLAMSGGALYLALEDNARRLKDRITLLLQHGTHPMPQNLHLTVGWPRLDQGGVPKLDEWLTLHPDTRLVVIDTLAKMRKKVKSNANLYEQDYAVGEELIQLASKHRIAIVLVTHTRKGKAESVDPVEEISGSLGLSAGVDGLLVLKRVRGQDSASLYVTGRDVPDECTYGLKWDKDSCRWSIEGNAGEVLINEARSKIVALLRQENRPLSAKDIATLSGRKYDATRRLLPDMVKDGVIDDFQSGNRWMYVHLGYQPPTSRILSNTNNTISTPNAHSAPMPPVHRGVLAQARLRAAGGSG